MPTRLNAPDVNLDHIHREAVLQGIGEKLRELLTPESPEMSQHLRMLIARLPELDRERGPSIVPEMANETH
jgi:hypothetical protein